MSNKLKEAANQLHAKYVELVAGPNARFLVSRNKREGWYFGETYGINLKDRRNARTWSKPAALRYKHIKFGKVKFAELGIKLYTPEEANGQS